MRSEVETTEIYREAQRQGKDTYYPRVLGDKMEFYLVDETTEFEKSFFGVFEPKAELLKQFVPERNDRIFVLMPGAVFDTEGNRIGYGGGYYDKYLHWLASVVPAQNIGKVAVAYQCQMVDLCVIKSEAHDELADLVITE